MSFGLKWNTTCEVQKEEGGEFIAHEEAKKTKGCVWSGDSNKQEKKNAEAIENFVNLL